MEESNVQHRWRESDTEHSNPYETQLSMYIPKEHLEKALEENKFRNAFEASGSYHAKEPKYMETRALAEHKVLGIPVTEDAAKRPVYGILRQKHNLLYPKADEPAAPAYAKERLYGNMMADIKSPRPDQHVTATYGDSLDNLVWHDKVGQATKLGPDTHSAVTPDNYTEVQWHDRPSPRTDIEAVHMTDDPMRGSQFLPNKDIGSPEHRARVSEARANAEQAARDLRLSGLRAPVYHWEKNIRYQPSMFSEDEGKRTEDWSRRQI